MKKGKTIMRKFVLCVTLFGLVLSTLLPVHAAEFAARYDAQAAVAYAEAHWDDGVGVCDEFVKTCLKAGGVEILAGGVDPLKDALLDAKLGSAQQLNISEDGVHALKSENANVQAGDIIFFYCEKCQRSIHTAIVGGYDENGYLYLYGHNPGWDKVDWVGNFTHTISNGQQHRKCYQYIVVTMDRNRYSHRHNFTTGFYEEVHPHKMYAQCSCNTRYYLGWNATVSYCTDCNVPIDDVPVVNAVSDGNAIMVEWTTVQNAVEYQVWRSRSETGTYFKIYAAMGTRITNKSVTSGETYYYKVVAVTAKDGNGNPTKTVSSAVVSCTLDNATSSVPGVPNISVELSNNKAMISWQAVPGAAKYEVWRATSENGTYTKLITTTKLTCSNTPKPNTYYYKVRAVDGNGQVGSFSNIVKVTIPSGNLTITGKLNSNNKAVISWQAVSGAVKYEVWRSTSENGTYSKLVTTENLYCINSPKPNTYYYKVRAVDGNGQVGSFSNIVSVKVP